MSFLLNDLNSNFFFFFFIAFKWLNILYIHLQMENIFIEKTKYFIFILISPLFFSGLMLYDVIWPQYDIGDVLQTSDALELVVLTRILQK